VSAQPINLTLTGISSNLMELYAYRQEVASDPEMTPAEQLETIRLIDDQIDLFVAAELDKADAIGYQLNEFNMRWSTCKTDAANATNRAAMWAKRVDDLEARTLKALKLRGAKKIEGARYTLRQAKNPPSVEITSAADVPKPYTRRELTLKADLYDRLMAHLMVTKDGQPLFMELQACKITDPEPMKGEITKELKANVAVAGARLVDDRFRLVVE
jgi:hypothetical protein